MNLIFLGYRGTGKTTIGKILKEKLKRKLINMDEEIIKKANMQIPEIVSKYGWDYFRDIESEVAEYSGKMDNCIIDAGGGVVIRQKNIENLKKNGKIILLTADAKTIAERIKGDKERPALKGKSSTEEIEEVLKERKERYLNAADYVIDTTKKSPEEAAEEIIIFLKEPSRKK